MTIIRILFFLFISLAGACRTDSSLENSKKPVDDEDPNRGISIVGEAQQIHHIDEKDREGIIVKLQNHLIAEKPDLSMQVCNNDIEGKHYCINIKGKVPFSVEEDYLFLLDQKHIDKILEHSVQKELSFYFNDTHSRAAIHWHCWNGSGVFDPNVENINVEVTQINNLSYSCKVTEL